ncbi:MAG TPA: glycosyltransferase family 4 protein [Chloroflexia bacterium]|nr:glycosyltransferase family 4 protein [Chloroflexia bacterium]
MNDRTEQTVQTAGAPLTVAILHYACGPIVGGVESIMATHARLLEREGYRTIILAGRGDPQSLDLDGEIIPEIDSMHPGVLAAQKALLAGEPGAIGAFEQWVERICERLVVALAGADVCIVHNAFTLHKNLALTVALARLAEDSRVHVRWIAWCHDLAWNNPLYSGELLSDWPWTVLKTPLPNVTYVAISEQRRQEMALLFGVRGAEIVLVPNGIDPEAFMPASPGMSALRERLGWNERDWVFLAPVRVTRRKNLELAIDIIGAIRALGQRPLLVITGPPGPHNTRSSVYLEELLARRSSLMLEEEVLFLAVEGAGGGPLEVSDAMMAELYWWSDALLMTSVQEGFGLPLLEAGLVRLPVFCTGIAVLREVGGGNANYFDPGQDPGKIAEMILNALEKPGVASLRRKVIADYMWDGIVHSKLLPLLHGQ